jgi:hypothetical protein
MIENRPVATTLAHLTLVLGVLIVAFPVYMTFVASTHTAEAIVQNVPMPLLPGDNLLQSYKLALFGGQTRLRQHHAAGGADDDRQPGQRAGHRHRQDRDLAAVGLCGGVLPLPRARPGVLDDLHHADAAGGGAHPAHLQDRVRPAACSTPTPA